MKRVFLLAMILALCVSSTWAQQFSFTPTYLNESINGVKAANRAAIEMKAVYAQNGLYGGYQVRLNNLGYNALDWQRIEVGGDPVFLLSRYPVNANIPSKYLAFYSLDFATSPYGKNSQFNGGGLRFITRMNVNVLDIAFSFAERSSYMAEAKLGWMRNSVFTTIGFRQQRFGFSDDIPKLDADGKVLSVEPTATNKVINSGMLEMGFIF